MSTQKPTNAAATIERVRSLVRSGHGALIAFDGPDAPWLEIAGPNGMAPGSDGFGVAPVPTLRLHRNGEAGPVAVAVANEQFAEGLHAIAQFARPLLGAEHPALVALLAAVRDAAADKRPRAPQVGAQLRETGSPNPAGWLSCLTLGDLQWAVEQSRIVRDAA